jgi:hypothetical protein
VIVVVGYFLVSLEIAVLWKFVFITISSFTITAGLYWLLIRRMNLLRIIFGMKMIRKEKREPEATLVLSPVMAETNRSLSEIRQKAF